MSATETSARAEMDLFRFLPSIYRATDAPPGRRPVGTVRERARDPFTALVRVIAAGYASIEAKVATAPRFLDPRTAPSLADGETRGFLEFLAGWVAFDPDILGVGSDRVEVLRHFVENAAALHAARGTPAATRYVLEVLFGAEVEILEWRWPASFQVGVVALVGDDTLLAGEPDLDHSVTVLWDTPRVRAGLSAIGGAGETLSTLELTAGDRPIASVVATPAAAGAPDTAEGALTGFRDELRRLRVVLARELPVQIASYIAFQPAAERAARDIRPFIVEVSSTVGLVRIEREP